MKTFGLPLAALVTLAGCASGPSKLDAGNLAKADSACLSRYPWTKGSATLLANCLSTSNVQFGRQVEGADYDLWDRLDTFRLQAASAVDRGAVTPDSAKVLIAKFRAQVLQQTDERRAGRSAARWARVGEALSGAAAGAYVAGQPATVTTTCNTLTPTFGTCTSTAN